MCKQSLATLKPLALPSFIYTFRYISKQLLLKRILLILRKYLLQIPITNNSTTTSKYYIEFIEYIE